MNDSFRTRLALEAIEVAQERLAKAKEIITCFQSGVDYGHTVAYDCLTNAQGYLTTAADSCVRVDKTGQRCVL